MKEKVKPVSEGSLPLTGSVLRPSLSPGLMDCFFQFSAIPITGHC